MTDLLKARRKCQRRRSPTCVRRCGALGVARAGDQVPHCADFEAAETEVQPRGVVQERTGKRMGLAIVRRPSAARLDTMARQGTAAPTGSPLCRHASPAASSIVLPRAA